MQGIAPSYIEHCPSVQGIAPSYIENCPSVQGIALSYIEHYPSVQDIAPSYNDKLLSCICNKLDFNKVCSSLDGEYVMTGSLWVEH